MRTLSLNRTSRAACIALIVPLIAVVAPFPKAVVTTLAQTQHPNILIIMTDDQGHDTLTDKFMPHTKSMIADQGINFSQGLMSTALCCPSRSSFLTGKYARNHGVHTNSDKLDQTTVADRLHDAGYYTGLIGKYLNSWPGDARPEYDYWACWKSGYTNPRMNLFGEFQNVPGYLTYILRDKAVDFLDQVPANKPFFMLFTPHAPHGPATPAPGDENLYPNLEKWRPPSFNPAEQPDKPQWLQDTPQLTDMQIKKEVDDFRLDQLRCLHSVDIAVRDVLNKLKEQHKLANTLIVFYSDNGYFWGEHRLLHKNRVYEEASHGPFALSYPPLVTTPRSEDRLVQVADLAPTIYELAGIPIPSDVDGRSLVPLMTGTANWRDAVLLEGWPGEKGKPTDEPDDDDVTQDQSQHYQAIRTRRYVYVTTDNDTPELYDLKKDEFQMNNLFSNVDYAKTVKKLSKRLSDGQF